MIHTEASLSRGKQGSRWALLSVTALVTMMISMGVGTPGLAAPATPDAGGSTTRADVGIRAATPENTGADATRAKTDRNATADKTADKATRTADATAAAPTGKAAPSASPSPAPSASKSVAKREARVQVEAPVTAASTDPQTITFPPQADLPMGTTGRTLNATAESGLPVSYTSTTMAVCTVTAGGVVTPVHVGTCTIEADQAGNGTWAPAPTAPGSFPVVKGDQTISFPAPGGVAMGTSASLDATASSGLAVAYTSTTTAVCTVTQEGVVTPVQVGTCTIQAEQDGDPDWNAATATSANFAITKGTQTITFGPLSDKLVTDAAFTVTAATSAPGLSVTFSSTDEAVCTVADGTVTLVAAGTCAIKAEQPGDANWKTATPVTQTFQVNRLAQSITFGPLADVAIGASPLTLGATASSGQAVVLTSTTTPVCTIAGNTVTLVAAGTCTIKAEQAGNATYAPAEPISRSFTVVGDPQTITFGPLADVSFTGGPVTLTATASSGLAVSYTSATTGVCTVASDKVTLVATGTCAIQADQAGDGTYRAAESVTRSFTVTPATQTITFPELADVAMTASPVALNATASSGLPVTYTSTNPEVCEITGALPSGVRGATATSTVTLNGPGTCTIEARQSGNANYQAAAMVVRHFQVTRAVQTIDFPQPSTVSLATESITLTATASSGLGVSYASTTPTVCTVVGPASARAKAAVAATITLVSRGECTIEASQGGNASYLPASAVSRTFTVKAAPPAGTPDTPTAVTAAAGVSSITATWTAPVPTGVTVTGYTAFAEPGEATCSTTGATTCVLGAEAGVTYRVRVIAHAATADSLPSEASNEVTPTAPKTPAEVPTTTLTLTTDKGDISTATPGQTIVIKGTGFAPFSTVTITIYSTPISLGSVVTDENGDFSIAVKVPTELAPGNHTFIAQGVAPDGSPRVMKLAVTVGLRNVSDTSDNLPMTGSALTGMFLVGIAATVSGAAMFTLSFRRPRRMNGIPQAG